MSASAIPPSGTSPVRVTTGLPETVLPDEPAEVSAALDAAAAHPDSAARRNAVADVVREHPRSPTAWATLGAAARDDVEAYACFRVGYHRGLDALRAAGWKGSGMVRWSHEPNRGFLRCLDGLRVAAGSIGESDEEDRCALFLRQLDPSWPSDREPVPPRSGSRPGS